MSIDWSRTGNLRNDTMFATSWVADRIDRMLRRYLEGVSDERWAEIGRRFGLAEAGRGLRRRIDVGTLTLLVLGEAMDLGREASVRPLSGDGLETMHVASVAVGDGTAYLAYDGLGRACFPAEIRFDGGGWFRPTLPAPAGRATLGGTDRLEALLRESAERGRWVTPKELQDVTWVVRMLGVGRDRPRERRAALARDVVACELADADQLTRATARQLVVALALGRHVVSGPAASLIDLADGARPSSIRIHRDGPFWRVPRDRTAPMTDTP